MTMIRMVEEDSPEVYATILSLEEKIHQEISSCPSLYATDLERREMEQFYAKFTKAFEEFKLFYT